MTLIQAIKAAKRNGQYVQRKYYTKGAGYFTKSAVISIVGGRRAIKHKWFGVVTLEDLESEAWELVE